MSVQCSVAFPWSDRFFPYQRLTKLFFEFVELSGDTEASGAYSENVLCSLPLP